MRHKMMLDELLAAGSAALVRGDWQEAESLFRQALAIEDSAEALEGLGKAYWWQDEHDKVLETRESAYRGYQAKGDSLSAARMATFMALDYAEFRGQMAVASGCLQRAESLLQGLEPSQELAWLHIVRGLFALEGGNDSTAAHAHAEEAAATAALVGSVDVAMVAQALKGLALIRERKVTEGLVYLDEAMAAAMGGDMSDLSAIGNTCCTLIYACEAIADYDRAAQWCERTREFCRRLGFDLFMFALCRNNYANVLIWRGKWDEAADELTAAIRELAPKRQSEAIQSWARLGELRRRQGRADEAHELFAKAGSTRRALVGLAAMALDRGDPDGALDLLQRALRRLNAEEDAERLFTLDLLLRARLAKGDGKEANGLVYEIAEIAAQVGTYPLRATAAGAMGRYAQATGDSDAARRHLEDALDLFETCGARFEAAQTRLDLSDVLLSTGRRDAALEQISRACTDFKSLHAEAYAKVALDRLARISGKVEAQFDALPYGLTPRESEVLGMIATGKTNQEIAEDLVLSVRTVERHISTIYEKLNLTGRSARTSAAAIAMRYQNT